MKLEKVEIENFRSIENLALDFSENPRVLVGINESGKTNILHALRLLSPNFSPQKDDIREPTKGSIENSEVAFLFQLETNEIGEIYQNVKQKILTDDFPKEIIKIDNKNYNLGDLCEYYNKGIYVIDIIKQRKTPKYYDFNDKIELIANFKKSKLGTVFSVQYKKGETVNISNFRLIDFSIYDNIPQEYLEDASAEDLNEIIGLEITKIIEKKLPNVIFWEYKDDKLLPPSISINTFIANPNSCIPLKNLFILAGVPEERIPREIAETKNKSPNTLRSLLKRVSNAATNYFRKAWPEYKNIKFSLTPNGENIDCGIEEKNVYDFKKRSDGFRRFISILILLSMPAKKEFLKNALILVDEADTSLHPSGCRYLMNQFIEIAKNNYVMYSTHSIFMIDRSKIERHYILEKNKEITSAKEATEDNYRDEEVLYKALGTSAFEILEEKNILFEGWTDKKLFETAIEKNKKLKKYFKSIGRSHAVGVKSIKTITPIIELSNRECLIISDCDQVSKEEQRLFQDEKGYGVWKRYDEIYQRRKIATCEDFIKKEILKENIFSILSNFDIEFQSDAFVLPDARRSDYIKNYLTNKEVSSERIKEIIKKLKDITFENLSLGDVEEDYFVFIENLQDELSKL